MRAFFRKSADALKLFFVVCMIVSSSACSAIMGVEPETGANSTTTQSPIASAKEIVAEGWFPAAYKAAKVCIVANGGVIRKKAPAYNDLHFFVVPDTIFYDHKGIGPFTSYAYGHTITFSFRYVTEMRFEHESAHLLTGEFNHNSLYWGKCGWLIASASFGL